MRRKEQSSKASPEVMVERALAICALRDYLQLDLMPAPAIQWFFGDWLGDRVVRKMAPAARAVHIDCCGYAWQESSFPCSLPAEGTDFDELFDELDDDEMQKVRRQFLRAWIPVNGRIWQRGLLKSWFAQLEQRALKALGPSLRADNRSRVLESLLVLRTLGVDAEEVVERSLKRADNQNRQALLSACKAVLSSNAWQESLGVPEESYCFLGSSSSCSSSSSSAVSKTLGAGSAPEGPPRATSESSTTDKQAEIRWHLRELEVTIAGFGEGWGSWKAAQGKTKAGSLWAQILRLRKLHKLSGDYTPKEMIRILEMHAEAAWQGVTIDAITRRFGKGSKTGNGSGRLSEREKESMT